MNSPTEPDLIHLRHDMEYIIHHPHEPIMYSRNKFFKVNEIPHKFFFKEANLSNVTIIDWCAKKEYETFRRSSNSETRVMYTGVLDKNYDFIRICIFQ